MPTSDETTQRGSAPGRSDDLDAERAYLQHAREELGRMRAVVEQLDAGQASDADSAAALGDALARRVQSLQDDPRTTLFFGRIDTDPQAGQDPRDPDRWYIGRRHVTDRHGDPVVVDWRAPVSQAFYRASPTEPMGLVRRRRFGVAQGRLTSLEDEPLTGSTTAGEGVGDSRILAQEIERPRTGPMRDIVSTIQPEQDVIVRSDVGTSVCVQGAPGTGKTAVGLHRAAWLLYSYRERLERTGVLVVGPNSAFLDHIDAVLPALGEVRVEHATIADLLAHAAVRAQESAAVATLKGSARLAPVLHRAVWAHVARVEQPCVIPRGARKWRVPAYQVQEIVDELAARGVRYDAARAMLPHRLAHAVLLQMERSGDSPDDRVQDAVAKSAAMKTYIKTLWPTLDPARVLFELWSDPDTLSRAAQDDLSSDEQLALLWSKPPRSKGSARWTSADMALLDELDDALVRRVGVGHLVLDEAQDLSPMQVRALGRRAQSGSVTVLGDIAQGTTPWATDSWDDTMRHLGKPEYELEVLDRGFRVPAAVIDYAARLLPAMAPDLGAPRSVRSNPGRLDLVRSQEAHVLDDLTAAVAAAALDPGTVGVIVADARVPAAADALSAANLAHSVLGGTHPNGESGGTSIEHPIQLVPASVAKGLEFDRVVVLEPDEIAAAEPDVRTGLRRLYVVLTRAVSALTVVHARPVPEQLRAG